MNDKNLLLTKKDKDNIVEAIDDLKRDFIKVIHMFAIVQILATIISALIIVYVLAK